MKKTAKALRFPLGGLATHGSFRETTYPSDTGVYSTPMANNVIGMSALGVRRRGGSRPGLRAFTGTEPIVSRKGRWLWPNGEEILWDDGKAISFILGADKTIAPDGSIIIEQHPTYQVSVTKGAAPSTCTAFARYRDRLVIANDTMWYASRTGDLGDFDYGGDAEDVSRAVAGSLALAGVAGEAITALAPFGDGRLYVSTKRRLGVIVGEPTSGMSMLSDVVGIVSANAWCNADGVLYFIGTNGLYATAGDGAPMLVSSSIPTELKGLASATLIYDPEWRGIHVFTPRHDYFYDVDFKAFWPVSYNASKRPVSGALCVIDGVNRVVFKCGDTKWRYWEAEQTTDDGSRFTSHISIGPFKCGMGDDRDGMLAEIYATLGNGSDSVGLSVSMADSAESSIPASVLTSDYTLTSGINNVIRPRKRGAWCVLSLSSTGKWAYESIQANTAVLGRLRV